jgi:diguanylate cyclase (GGDEF)-like protein/PAS domain S-box-containing protein
MNELKLDNMQSMIAADEVSAISSALLSEIFHGFEEAILVADTNRRLVYMNLAAERLFGYSKQQLYGKVSQILYADENDFSEQGRHRYNLASEKPTENYRILYRRSDGEIFLGVTTGTIMHSSDGAVIGFLGLIRPARSADQSLDALQKIHNVTSDLSLSYEQKIESLLTIGLNHFGLETAIMSHIAGNVYTVENCVDFNGQLKPKTQFDLEGTYCVHTLKENKTVGFHFVGKSQIQNHPCYKSFQLESYIGTPLKLDNKLYGTVNFTSSSPVDPFCKDDYILMQLLSDTFSYLLYKKVSEEELETLARIDELTSLPNRRATFERLHQLIDQSNRFFKKLCVLSIDLDHFKKINDKYGHAAGDQALVEFAQIASGIGRKTDFCGRIGGEEFIFVLTGANIERAEEFGNKLRHTLALHPVKLNSEEFITITISAGVAMLDNNESIESLLARADEAMYNAKQQGRDRVMIAPPSP